MIGGIVGGWLRIDSVLISRVIVIGCYSIGRIIITHVKWTTTPFRSSFTRSQNPHIQDWHHPHYLLLTTTYKPITSIILHAFAFINLFKTEILNYPFVGKTSFPKGLRLTWFATFSMRISIFVNCTERITISVSVFCWLIYSTHYKAQDTYTTMATYI